MHGKKDIIDIVVKQILLQSRNLFGPTKTRLYAEIRSTDGCSFFVS